MSKITLEVPDGNKCSGCMFLEEDTFTGYCRLFKEQLRRLADINYSSLKVTDPEISKCSQCPKGN